PGYGATRIVISMLLDRSVRVKASDGLTSTGNGNSHELNSVLDTPDAAIGGHDADGNIVVVVNILPNIILVIHSTDFFVLKSNDLVFNLVAELLQNILIGHATVDTIDLNHSAGIS